MLARFAGEVKGGIRHAEAPFRVAGRAATPVAWEALVPCQ